jgi:hypothetical protein
MRTSQIAYNRDQLINLLIEDLKMKGLRIDDDYQDEYSAKFPESITFDVSTIEAKMFKRGKKGIGSKP